MSAILPDMKRLTLLCTLLLASPLASQQLTIRGVVEPDEDAPGSFCLDCTDAVLTSSTVNLADFAEVAVELTGSWNGSATDPVLDVTAIAPLPASFAITGSDVIGESLAFRIAGPAGHLAATFYARDRGFTALPSGVLLLDLATMASLGAGVVSAEGVFQVTTNIPNNPALVGLDAYGQGFLFSAGTLTFTNVDCFRVRAPNG